VIRVSGPSRNGAIIVNSSPVNDHALSAFVTRLFGGSVERIERMRSGVSTPVYRLKSASEVFYLRLAETPQASLASEARVHMLLRERGVRVPDVVSFEPFEETLGRSVLITTEIAGEPVAARAVDATTRRIVREAGRELAIINEISVQGYGWIDREHEGTELRAEYATRGDWTATYVAAVEQLVHARRLGSRAAQAARSAVELWAESSSEKSSWLAHGDFDVSHIFQRGGRYTGVIDFGEIRGADRWYDLGHVHLHDGETLSELLFPDLLAGYLEVLSTPADLIAQVELEAVVIGLMAFARTIGKPDSTYTRWLERRLRQLLNRVSLW
jgi:aminoglycoside phosphotransferase (APT) family kinase protein